MIAAGVVTVTLLIPGGQPSVIHVTGQKVTANAPISRAERCQARIDARRLIAGRPLTRGLPRRCMTNFDRRRHPDAWGKVR
jgi:hypothetical protein